MIGVFDSGVGGLTVVKQISKQFPRSRIIYFGDTARLPYGTKGADFVKKYSSKITEWLLGRGAKIIVIACHTSSAWAGDFLKKKFKNRPVFDMISPAIKDVLSLAKNRKIGIIGTPGTIKSGSWEKNLLKADPKLEIYSRACPLFVPLVEEGWIEKKATAEIAKEYLKEFQDREVDVLVLACTHYPMLKKVIRRAVGPKVKIIDPAESLALQLVQIYKGRASVNFEGKYRFFFSDEPYNLKKISRLCLGQEIKAQIIDPF